MVGNGLRKELRSPRHTRGARGCLRLEITQLLRGMYTISYAKDVVAGRVMLHMERCH